ncbi:MAG TPA: lanthionine synthetase LanC family protein, partial [Isosphaeraceae bacterium]|nr:lanthionine synthetase LanC family protein [Isosphaeraceae bacterium]
EIHSAVAAGLRGSVPMFTKRLAHGLGFAEDPNDSRSFGEHRCQLTANALWQSFCRGEFDQEARAATMAATFVEAGLDPLQPHLGPGSRLESSLVAFPFASFPRAVRVENQTETGRDSSPQSSFLATAIRIGTRLCQSAFWDIDGRHCNWIGCTNDGAQTGSGRTAVTAEAISHDVYEGSSGIALFLAQLCELSGEKEFGRTASGAIRRSLRQLSRVRQTRQTRPISFFGGDLGVGFVARKTGQATHDPELTAAADATLLRMAESVSQPHDLDLISGNAGAIPTLLCLAESPGLEYCRELAIELGRELCQKAVQQSVGCGWHRDSESGSGVVPVPLTGFSHGAAGIGLALFELYSATGTAAFLEAARGAFDYEDSLFDSRERNWPDLRLKSDRPQFGRFWCHGAPGIALARLRAATIDAERADQYLATARLALSTTLDAVEQLAESPGSDTSLCHGLSGLGEVLLIAGQILKDASCHDRAMALGRGLIERHAAWDDWPSGVPSGGPNPSLMLGVAGVGYWLLRLNDPASVPSVLLLVS